MKTKFLYEHDPALARVRAEQRNSANVRTAKRDATRRLKEAKDALYLIEFRAGFEAIKPADLARARAEQAAAQKAFDDASAILEPRGDAAKYLADLEGKLARAERDANLARLRPLYAEVVRRLDRALADAAAIAEEASELEEAALGMAYAVPSSWARQLSLQPKFGSDYDRWRKEAIRDGWLKGS